MYTNMKLKKRALQSDKYVFGWNQTKKNWQNNGACFSVNIGFLIFKNPLHFWKGAGCSGIIFSKDSKYLWRNVHRKMGAFSIQFVTFTSTLVVV